MQQKHVIVTSNAQIFQIFSIFLACFSCR